MDFLSSSMDNTIQILYLELRLSPKIRLRDLVNKSFISLYTNFQTDFVIESFNTFTRKCSKILLINHSSLNMRRLI